MLKLDLRIDELVGLTFLHYGVEIKRPTIKFDLRGLAAGVARCYENSVSFNPILLVENPDQFLLETVGHEFCHLSTRRIHPKAAWNHGRQWQSIMRTCGVPVVIDHRYDVSTILGKTPKLTLTSEGKRIRRCELDEEMVIFQDYVGKVKGFTRPQ